MCCHPQPSLHPEIFHVSREARFQTGLFPTRASVPGAALVPLPQVTFPRGAGTQGRWEDCGATSSGVWEVTRAVLLCGVTEPWGLIPWRRPPPGLVDVPKVAEALQVQGPLFPHWRGGTVGINRSSGCWSSGLWAGHGKCLLAFW